MGASTDAEAPPHFPSPLISRVVGEDPLKTGELLAGHHIILETT
jgi:hypothetical protein